MDYAEPDIRLDYSRGTARIKADMNKKCNNPNIGLDIPQLIENEWRTCVNKLGRH